MFLSVSISLFAIDYCLVINIRKMLTNVLKVLVNNLFKESFYEKKTINVLTNFFIFHKNNIKTFLKLIIN